MPLGSRALGVPVHCELGFRAFGLGLAARVVRTRGSFGAFLLSTLHLCQDRPPRPAHALFPLPVLFPGCCQHIRTCLSRCCSSAFSDSAEPSFSFGASKSGAKGASSGSKCAHGDPLQPYASLCADRLKISGLGRWDPVPFLDSQPDLQVACLEPDVLLHGAEPPPEEVPDLSRERPGEVLRLALKWADKGLLYLKEDYSDQVACEDSVRVFNCYKAPDCDRQIGDRRARNFRERALRGFSISLPCGPVFLGPAVSTLRIAVADRKDFYHQLWAGPRKAVHNAMFPLSLRRILLAPKPMDFCAKGVVQQSLLRCWCLRPAGPRSLPVSRLFFRGTTWGCKLLRAPTATC